MRLSLHTSCATPTWRRHSKLPPVRHAQLTSRCCQRRWGSAVVHLAYSTFQQCHRHEHYRQCDSIIDIYHLAYEQQRSVFKHTLPFMLCHSSSAIWKWQYWYCDFTPIALLNNSVFFPRANHDKIIRSSYLIPSSPLLVPWSRKSRAIPLLHLWAVRPVQSLSACTRVHFTFFTLLNQARFIKLQALTTGRL